MTAKGMTKIFTAALCLALLFQSGCAGRSRSARFYVLTPEAGADLATGDMAAGIADAAVTIAPVSLPKYLRKAQIVTRTGGNELHLAEYERWAGKLEEDIGRVIAENMNRLLASDKVLYYPTVAPATLDYEIKIVITRFEGSLGGDIELIARWAVFDRRGDMVSGFNATRITEPATGGDYEHLVAAQSRALAALSRELAAVIKELTAG